MKAIISKLSILFFLVLFSCSSSEQEIIEPVYNYSIQILNQPIQFEETTFKITSDSNDGLNNVNYVEWNFGNGLEDSNNQINYTYTDFGNKNVTAKVYGNNNKIYTVSLDFDVSEKEYYIVKIKEIEVTGIGSAIWNQYSYNAVGGTYISLSSNFIIREFTDSGEAIMYQSDINDVNDRTSYSNFHNIIWTLNDPYETKVYKTGNYYPTNKSNFYLSIYGQKTITNGVVNVLGENEISLNEYRNIKPSEITYTFSQTNYGVTFKLKVEWLD